MNCPEIPILPTCIVGAVVGAALHGIAAKRKGEFSSLIFLEAMTQGFLMAGALHLMFCIACPSQLVELLDKKNGQVMPPKAIDVHLETLHGVEIFIASVMLAMTSVRALKSAWDKPGH